ncbi:MAG TPA: hypothetical protein VGF86_07440 [Candidatus Tumulicola sp.]
MIAGIEAPVSPASDILLRASRPDSRPSRGGPPVAGMAAVAAAAAGIVLAATPLVAPGLVAPLAARIAELMQWTPPPSPPKSVNAAMVPRLVSLATARSLVTFRIVPPTGLPRDVVSEKIFATPIGVYSKITHAWTVGPPSLTFSYRRSNGREFQFSAEKYDPHAGAPPKYLFDADETGPNGLPKRHEHFAWRNGDQSMSATEDDDLATAEIEAVRAAMHGTPLRRATSRAELHSGVIVKQYRIP